MARLSSQVKELAIELGMVPESVAEITAAGGRLGVAFEDLPEFTRLAGQMAVAFDMTAESAGDSAAKLANVFQIPLSEVRALGDAINTLGNNTAAKESEIVEALTRIGGSAKQFGLATEQTAALSAAFIALGKSPETASTAINALLNRLQTGGQGVSGFAEGLEDLGLSANRLADNIRANPQAALREFLGSLEKLDNQQRAITLTKLFGQEYADDISLMVGSLAEYDRQLGLVGDKTKTAGAMQNEFASQMDTTEKKLEQARIAIGNLAKELGSQLLPVVRQRCAGICRGWPGRYWNLPQPTRKSPALSPCSPPPRPHLSHSPGRCVCWALRGQRLPARSPPDIPASPPPWPPTARRFPPPRRHPPG